MTGPLGQVVVYLDNPQAVENMAGGFECCRNPGNMPKVEKGWKGEPHPASFVGDQRSTTAAADFARKNSLMPLAFTVEKSQLLDSMGYSHITLIKDGRPLHRRTVQFLAGQAVAEFGIQGVRTDFVLNRAAMAACTVFRYEIRIPDRSVIRAKLFFHLHLYSSKGFHVFSAYIVAEPAYP